MIIFSFFSNRVKFINKRTDGCVRIYSKKFCSRVLVFPARLKNFRKEKGLTQKQFAEWIGISNNNISQYEKGLHVPEIKTALKMKRALNKPLDWIYFGDEEIIPKSRTRDSG